MDRIGRIRPHPHARRRVPPKGRTGAPIENQDLFGISVGYDRGAHCQRCVRKRSGRTGRTHARSVSLAEPVRFAEPVSLAERDRIPQPVGISLAGDVGFS
jgi:hypothetical protein